MTKTTNTQTPETEVQTSNVTAAAASKTAKGFVRRVSMDDAICDNIRKGKTFDLIRSVYESSKNGKSYYSYSVFLIICNGTAFEEVRLSPDIGFISEDNKNQRSGRNSTSYRLMNWLYDMGQGLKLEIRERTDKNNNKFFDYYSVGYDESGIGAEVLMKPQSPGDERFLRAGFAGFGNCRDYVQADFNKIPGLKEAFGEMLLPGVIPDKEVQQDIE